MTPASTSTAGIWFYRPETVDTEPRVDERAVFALDIAMSDGVSPAASSFSPIAFAQARLC